MPTTILCDAENEEYVFCDASFRTKNNRRSIERALATSDIAKFEHYNWYATIQVFVDEPVPPEFERRAKQKHHGALRLPSGLLRAIDQERIENHERYPENEMTVPAGNYLVEAFELDWGKERERAADAASIAASALGHGLSRFQAWAMLALLLVTAASSWLTNFVPGLVLILCLVGAWASILMIGTTPPVAAAAKARNATLDTFPNAIIRLSPLNDDIATHRGVKFGGR